MMLAVNLYYFSTTSLPNGVNAKPASLKCCFANGIPTIAIIKKSLKLHIQELLQNPRKAAIEYYQEVT
jgi:hypothetical protein